MAASRLLRSQTKTTLTNTHNEKVFVGRRTGQVFRVKASKNPDGFDNIDDYFTDSEALEDYEEPENVPPNPCDEMPSAGNKSQIQKGQYIGRRTGALITINARVNKDGFANVDDFFSESVISSGGSSFSVKGKHRNTLSSLETPSQEDENLDAAENNAPSQADEVTPLAQTQAESPNLTGTAVKSGAAKEPTPQVHGSKRRLFGSTDTPSNELSNQQTLSENSKFLEDTGIKDEGNGPQSNDKGNAAFNVTEVTQHKKDSTSYVDVTDVTQCRSEDDTTDIDVTEVTQQHSKDKTVDIDVAEVVENPSEEDVDVEIDATHHDASHCENDFATQPGGEDVKVGETIDIDVLEVSQNSDQESDIIDVDVAETLPIAGSAMASSKTSTYPVEDESDADDEIVIAKDEEYEIEMAAAKIKGKGRKSKQSVTFTESSKDVSAFDVEESTFVSLGSTKNKSKSVTLGDTPDAGSFMIDESIVLEGTRHKDMSTDFESSHNTKVEKSQLEGGKKGRKSGIKKSKSEVNESNTSRKSIRGNKSQNVSAVSETDTTEPETRTRRSTRNNKFKDETVLSDKAGKVTRKSTRGTKADNDRVVSDTDSQQAKRPTRNNKNTKDDTTVPDIDKQETRSSRRTKGHNDTVDSDTNTQQKRKSTRNTKVDNRAEVSDNSALNSTTGAAIGKGRKSQSGRSHGRRVEEDIEDEEFVQGHETDIDDVATSEMSNTTSQIPIDNKEGKKRNKSTTPLNQSRKSKTNQSRYGSDNDETTAGRSAREDAKGRRSHNQAPSEKDADDSVVEDGNPNSISTTAVDHGVENKSGNVENYSSKDKVKEKSMNHTRSRRSKGLTLSHVEENDGTNPLASEDCQREEALIGEEEGEPYNSTLGTAAKLPFSVVPSIDDKDVSVAQGGRLDKSKITVMGQDTIEAENTLNEKTKKSAKATKKKTGANFRASLRNGSSYGDAVDFEIMLPDQGYADTLDPDADQESPDAASSSNTTQNKSKTRKAQSDKVFGQSSTDEDVSSSTSKEDKSVLKRGRQSSKGTTDAGGSGGSSQEDTETDVSNVNGNGRKRKTRKRRNFVVPKALRPKRKQRHDSSKANSASESEREDKKDKSSIGVSDKASTVNEDPEGAGKSHSSESEAESKRSSKTRPKKSLAESERDPRNRQNKSLAGKEAVSSTPVGKENEGRKTQKSKRDASAVYSPFFTDEPAAEMDLPAQVGVPDEDEEVMSHSSEGHSVASPSSILTPALAIPPTPAVRKSILKNSIPGSAPLDSKKRRVSIVERQTSKITRAEDSRIPSATNGRRSSAVSFAATPSFHLSPGGISTEEESLNLNGLSFVTAGSNTFLLEDNTFTPGMSSTRLSLPSSSGSSCGGDSRLDTDLSLSGEVTISSAKRKQLLQEAEEGLRRSKRTKVQPLKYWKNERIRYERRQSGWYVDGIERQPTPKVPKRKKSAKGRRPKPKTSGANVRSKSMDESSMEVVPEGMVEEVDPMVTVVNPETGEEVVMELLHTPAMLNFVNPARQPATPDDPIVIDKYMSHNVFGAGQLELRGMAEKTKQSVRGDTMVFFLMKGAVEVTIHQTSAVLSSGSTFFVPQGHSYSIKNLRDSDAKLWFVQVKG
ncbi:centromere protein C [Nematostella vectensis]|uniref:centromere protein C n=1 Tax=Nematostella vectensis TaxID=45351 RepID=UPI00139047A6|nr:centromere protein C [Nematostella vectensis]